MDVRHEPEVSPVVAAGALVWRHGAEGLEVCVVHRPKHDDWTIPKGKVEHGEHLLTCAVREVAEETGHRITLGRPLPAAHYDVNGKPKIVYFWAAEADPHAPERQADHEIDDVRFLSADDALSVLTYQHDRLLVMTLLSSGHGTCTTPLVILRHASAVPRSEWPGADNARPLNAYGREQAQNLVKLLDVFGVETGFTSPAYRCVDTVRPWAHHRGVALTVEPDLSEEGFTPEGVAHVSNRLRGMRVVMCTHRPVLPHALSRFGLEEGDVLRAGEFTVAHMSDGRVVATERHIA